MITVAPLAMMTLSFMVGTTPPAQVVVELQSPPVTVEVIFPEEGACVPGKTVDCPRVHKLKVRIRKESRLFFIIHFYKFAFQWLAVFDK